MVELCGSHRPMKGYEFLSVVFPDYETAYVALNIWSKSLRRIHDFHLHYHRYTRSVVTWYYFKNRVLWADCYLTWWCQKKIILNCLVLCTNKTWDFWVKLIRMSLQLGTFTVSEVLAFGVNGPCFSRMKLAVLLLWQLTPIRVLWMSLCSQN